jgi:hypothetical protein
MTTTSKTAYSSFGIVLFALLSTAGAPAHAAEGVSPTWLEHVKARYEETAGRAPPQRHAIRREDLPTSAQRVFDTYKVACESDEDPGPSAYKFVVDGKPFFAVYEPFQLGEYSELFDDAFGGQGQRLASSVDGELGFRWDERPHSHAGSCLE